MPVITILQNSSVYKGFVYNVFIMEGYSFYTWWYCDLRATHWSEFQFLSDAKKQTKNKNANLILFLYKEWHAPVKTLTSSLQQHTSPGAKKEHNASSISNQHHLKRGCVHEHLAISHNWQSNGILHCRKSKQTSFLLSSNWIKKRFLEMSIEHGNKLLFSNKKSLSQKRKKRCIQLWFKTFANGRIAIRLMMVQIDMEYQAELKHKL